MNRTQRRILTVAVVVVPIAGDVAERHRELIFNGSTVIDEVVCLGALGSAVPQQVAIVRIACRPACGTGGLHRVVTSFTTINTPWPSQA